MRRVTLVVVAAAATAALALVAGASAAAPFPGATFFHGTTTTSGQEQTSVDTHGQCPFGVAPTGGAQLTLDEHGWGLDSTGFFLVSAQWNVHGTLTDTAGRAYHLEANLDEERAIRLGDFFEPRLLGTGHIVIAGSGGVVAGVGTVTWNPTPQPTPWGQILPAYLSIDLATVSTCRMR